MQLNEFFERFRQLLSSDSRFDIWIHAPRQRATIVWDRHNQIFAYGPLGQYEAALKVLGFAPGEVVTPVPHAHHYHQECDAQARALLVAYDWIMKPLQPEDEQPISEGNGKQDQ